MTLGSGRPLTGFPPIAGADARILILGSMPGSASLNAGHYYAHPRNAFWPIVAALLEWPVIPVYAQREVALRSAGIALWDVLRECRRAGSLDTAIDADSIRCNDFASFYRRHPQIAVVACNGGMAERLYRTRVRVLLPEGSPPVLRLPSTSPAHAGRNLATKLQIWRSELAPFLAR